MNTYFYSTSSLLAPGSIIEPGNWWRIICSTLHVDQQLRKYFVETIYEEIRKTEFRDKVSRLSCIFLCETEHGARNFMRKTGRACDILYEVVPVLNEPKITFCNYDLYNFNVELYDYVENLKSAARNYWLNQSDETNRELLVESSIKVIRRCT